ncbi:MAG: Coenzyme F420 hydrogenase/dehydrogenase, beta subunit C-terminal domain, partial [Eubacteriales bacterium]|nr:Coenzyme F420 hydrogenase/dehydrogenase, beta subunit C-terminal domain [Eubacteriales bacterium]
QCKDFCGSKYVQSDMRGVAADIRRKLQIGKTVLFTGTPCQCAGISRFMGNSQKKLILCCLVCHGVPTPTLVEKYLDEIERQDTRKALKYVFRYYDGQKIAWGKNQEKIIFDDGTDMCMDENVLNNLFYTNCFLRESCYSCPFYAKEVADITVMDAWGIREFMPTFDGIDYGVSGVIIANSAKREFIEKSIRQAMNIESIPSDTLKKYQPQLNQPIGKSPKRNKMMKMLLNKGAVYTYNVFRRRKKVKEKIAKIIGR